VGVGDIDVPGDRMYRQVAGDVELGVEGRTAVSVVPRAARAGNGEILVPCASILKIMWRTESEM